MIGKGEEKTLNESNINIYSLEDEYLRILDPLFEDDRLLKIKTILNNPTIIKPYERRIFLVYLETGSLRKAEEVCKVSHTHINNICKRVIKKIQDELK